MLLAGYVRKGPPPPAAAWTDPRRLETIRMLVEKGAAVGAQDSGGNSALHYASQRGATEIIALLEQLGASQAVKNKDGKVPADLQKKS